jgi:hypothetical protein
VNTAAIIDPSGTETGGDGFTGVVRPTSLSGVRLGVLDNGKPNAEHVVRTAARGVRARVELAEVMGITKPVASRPIADEALVRFKGFDAAIVGVGD